LNAPASHCGLALGFDAIGGRKKKSGFPEECVASEMEREGGAEGSAIGLAASPPLQPLARANTKQQYAASHASCSRD
jgi:hypothetical protein